MPLADLAHKRFVAAQLLLDEAVGLEDLEDRRAFLGRVRRAAREALDRVTIASAPYTASPRIRIAAPEGVAVKRIVLGERVVALEGGNIFEELMNTVRYASLGQITRTLYAVGGQYRRSM